MQLPAVYSRMGGRGSDVGSDTIAFIHVSDGEPWALFLQKLLGGQDYNIESSLHLPDHKNTPDLFSKAQTCAVLVSPNFLEGDYGEFWYRCVNNFNSRTVLLLLGVDRVDLRTVLGHLADRIPRDRWLEVNGTRDAVSTALVKLIEAYEANEQTSQTERSDYEDDEDVYDRPPPPRQQNGVIKVAPSVLYEHSDDEIVVVLEREAEGEVWMVTEGGGGPSQHITLTHIVGSAYSAQLSNLRGRVSFTVVCGDHHLGVGCVTVQPSLEQLASLLRREISPVKLMCSAMGISHFRCSDTEELDATLAARLAGARLPLGLTNLLMPDDQSAPEVLENSQWPTLLHFAADFNLCKLCEELLRYPSMIHAAVTENREGLYPCQLAEKHGYTDLQRRLRQYVENMRLRSAADSGISFEKSPAPSPHTSVGHGYVNERPPSKVPSDAFDDSYMDMTGFLPPGCVVNGEVFADPADGRISHIESRAHMSPDPSCKQPPCPPLACQHALGYGYVKPRSYSDGNLRTPYSRQPAESRIKEVISEDGAPPLQPKKGRSFSICAPGPSDPLSESGEKSENETDSSGDSVPETLVSRLSVAPELRDSVLSEGGESCSRPVSTKSSSSLSDYEVPPSQASTSDSPRISQAEESPVLRTLDTKRSKSVQDKISHFFKKIKPRRQQSSSESDLPQSSKSGKKPIYYMRQSTSSSCSDPLDYPTLKKSDSQRSSSSVACAERDSGAVCDEQGSPVLMRSRGAKTSRFSKKDGNGNMDKRLSVRVQKAKKEEISEAPTLPRGRRSSKEASPSFVSYM